MKTLRLYVALTVANTAIWTSILGPLIVVLPLQIEQITPGVKVVAYAILTGIGGLLGIATAPLAGALSDRTRSRLGRRRPWVAFGGLAGAAMLLLVGASTSLNMLTATWALSQIAVAFSIAAVTAVIPDQVPAQRRGAASACLGVSWAAGPVLGAVLATLAADDFVLAYRQYAVVLAAGVLFFLAVCPDPPFAGPPAPVVGPHAPSNRQGQRRRADFTWAWVTRFCLSMGQNLSTVFLLYYLTDVIGYEDRFPGQTAEDGLLTYIALYTLLTVIMSIVGGLLSDRLRSRKAFVIVSAVVFAVGAGVLAVLPNWTGVLVMAVLTGLGFGVYQSVDTALVTEVLPDADERGRDLGVINIATAIPLVFAGVFAAPVLEYMGGYPVLYALSAVIALAGAAAVIPIRAVR